MRYVLLILTFYFAAGTWFQVGDNITRSGTTSETFKFADFAGNSYWRNVSATNSSITQDEQGGSLVGTLPVHPWITDETRPPSRVEASMGRPII